MKIPFLDADAREGETSREHLRRMTGVSAPYWMSARVLASYTTTLLDRIDELERRVAALEKGR